MGKAITIPKSTFMTTQEFANRIGVARSTVVKWDRNGKLKAHHVSPTGFRYYTEEQVQDYFNNGYAYFNTNYNAKP